MSRSKKSLSIFSLLLIVALVLAGCTPAATATQAPQPTSAPQATSGTSGGAQLEIFSWWTNGGEATGLNKMYEIFTAANPSVEIVNATVAGGAGTNAKTVLKTRLQGGQPPDSWQVHAGKELVSYVDAGQMQPLTDFFAEQGWNEVMPPLLLEQITYQGEIWSVPVNIHRSNVLWYNKQVFADAGLEPPTTFDEFFAVAEALQAADIIPLAVGGLDKFETPHLFESVLLGTFGATDYAALFQPGADWSDPRVNEAIGTLEHMLEFSNSDRSAIGWAAAMDLVLEGRAAMTIMGDWAHGYALSKGAEPDVDYGWVAAPNNQGVFMWLSDSFGLAAGAPHPEEAMAWLAVCGSREGQDAFNPAKGSIPARTDADRSLYDVYLQYSMDAFSSDTLAPSIVHGAAAPEAYMLAYGNALNVFSSDLDEQTLGVALTDAVVEIK
jgi:glucose/mannose transport system substrate-binding protein